MTSFTQCVVETIKSIPIGEVRSYGEIAAICGSPRGARQVVRVLHTMSQSQGLPWHRVVRKDMTLPQTSFVEEQKARLEEEGLQFIGNQIHLNV